MSLHGDFRQRITPIVLTFDEAPNLARMLDGVAWADRIVVVDSFSTDETLAIADRFAQVEVFQRRFDTHAEQWQWALTHTGVDTEWALCMDADWIMPPAMATELAGLHPAEAVTAYTIAFRYCVYGEPLRASLYPPVPALFRREAGRFEQDGHTQRLRIEGRRETLTTKLDHDDRKSLSRWLWAQGRYAELEASRIRSGGRGLRDRLRAALVIAPWLVPLHFLLMRGGLFDGPAGWFYAGQRAVFETLLALRLAAHRWPEALGGRSARPDAGESRGDDA